MDTNFQTATRNSLVNSLEGLLAKKPIILQILRFTAIGVLNTALDFLVLNFLSKTLGISSGIKLGQVNVAGFILAVIQSYFWNRYWAFGAQTEGLWKNFLKLLAIGGLGGIGMVLVLLGATFNATGIYFLIILVVYVLVQVVFWKNFGLSEAKLSDVVPKVVESNSGNKIFGYNLEFWLFLLISLIGLFINSGLIALITGHIQLAGNADLNKNLAKILATGASLVWNFAGYKLVVFKK